MRLLHLLLLFFFIAASARAGTPEMQAKAKELEVKLKELEKNGEKKAKKIPGGMATLKGRLLTEHIGFVTEAYFADKDKNRGEQYRKAIADLVKRTDKLVAQGGSLCVDPGQIVWQPLDDDGKIKAVDRISIVGGVDEKKIASYLAGGRWRTWLDPVAGPPDTKAEPVRISANDKGFFDSYQSKKIVNGIIFYVRTRKAQKIKLKISGLQKTNKLEAFFVNSQPQTSKQSAKVELLEGINSIFYKIDNSKGGKLTFTISVDGKDLEVYAQKKK